MADASTGLELDAIRERHRSACDWCLEGDGVGAVWGPACDTAHLLAEVERLRADAEEANRAALAWREGSKQAWAEVDRRRARAAAIEHVADIAREITGQVNGRMSSHRLNENFHEHLVGELREALSALDNRTENR